MKHECYICIDPLKAYNRKGNTHIDFFLQDTVLINGRDAILRDKKSLVAPNARFDDKASFGGFYPSLGDRQKSQPCTFQCHSVMRSSRLHAPGSLWW